MSLVTFRLHMTNAHENGRDAEIERHRIARSQWVPIWADPARSDEVSATGDAPTLTEWLVAHFREALRKRGLGDWQIFCLNADADLWHHVDGPLAPAWDDMEFHPVPLIHGGEQPAGGYMNHVAEPQALKPMAAGLVHLRQHEIAGVRWWQWVRVERRWVPLALWAAPALDRLETFRKEAVRRERQAEEFQWQIIGGRGSAERSIQRKVVGTEQLLLSTAVRDRYEREIAGFFTEPVRQMYEQLGVPYRRGVLLHGPPGNGKTSLVRQLGVALPGITALLLRTGCDLEEGDLSHAVVRWISQAPAMLVVEDLDTLFNTGRVSLSTFLNLIDGVDGEADGGLLLIGTTNRPEALDPALNNRPGRFDVVLELPAPDAALRRQFFERRLHETDAALREQLVQRTANLSFAHLEEVLRISGLTAVHDRRDRRTAGDLLAACDQIQRSQREAMGGFPGRDGVMGFQAGSRGATPTQ